MRLVGAILVGCLLMGGEVMCREDPADSLEGYFTFSEPSPFSCLLALFPPLLVQRGNELKEFIRSDEFLRLRRLRGDERAVDAIFVRAMQLTDNNTGVALLLSAVCTFDHDVVGLRIPVLQIAFPLTSETEEDFLARRGRLPSHFYGDSPAYEAGDRDKLQHFFGSAFVTFIFESPQTAERFGDFVEQGEDRFIIDGVADDRDYRANRQGQLFGLALLEDNRRYPSDFLRAVIASEPCDLSSSPEAW